MVNVRTELAGNMRSYFSIAYNYRTTVAVSKRKLREEIRVGLYATLESLHRYLRVNR